MTSAKVRPAWLGYSDNTVKYMFYWATDESDNKIQSNLSYQASSERPACEYKPHCDYTVCDFN